VSSGTLNTITHSLTSPPWTLRCVKKLKHGQNGSWRALGARAYKGSGGKAPSGFQRRTPYWNVTGRNPSEANDIMFNYLFSCLAPVFCSISVVHGDNRSSLLFRHAGRGLMVLAALSELSMAVLLYIVAAMGKCG